MADTKISLLTDGTNPASASAEVPVALAGQNYRFTLAELAPGVLSSSLYAFNGLTSAADTLPYWSGAGTATTTTLSSAGRALIDDADANAQRTTLGLAIGTNVQAFSANLSAFAALSLVADRLPYANGTGTLALATFTAAGRALIDDADATAQRTTLGLGTSATVNTGTSGTTIPLLDGANTWSGAQTFNSTILSSGTQAGITFYETDAGVDYKRWRHYVDGGGTYVLALINDAYNAESFVYSIARSTHTSSTLTFPSTTTFAANGSSQFNGTLTATSTFEIANANPSFRFYESDAGSDAKRWQHVINSGIYYFRTRTDADGAGQDIFTVTRTGIAAATTWTGTVTFSSPIVASNAVPAGGTSGQVLSKSSGTDYALQWSTPSGGSMTIGKSLALKMAIQ